MNILMSSDPPLKLISQAILWYIIDSVYTDLARIRQAIHSDFLVDLDNYSVSQEAHK